ncbi:MAG: M20/M25/M40 family metallo-hydrolase [Promethearchaeia archaeon]
MYEHFEELLEQTNEDFIENDLRPFLQIPSNSLNSKGITNAKKFILKYIHDVCDDIIELKGEINPLFLGKVSGKREHPLLIYMMYDTQPVYDINKWICKPFEAKISKLPAPLDSLGDCIIARGAYNSKSPLMCFLNTIKILKKKDALPNTLFLLFDGEEEMGSPTLLQTLENKPDLFNGCDAAYYPAAKQDLTGNAEIKLGYKGILSLNLQINTPNKEPHSAFSAMIPNPATEMVTILNKLYSNYEFKIYSLKQEYNLTSEEQQILAELGTILDLEKIKKKAGITLTRFKDAQNAFKEYLFSPTFNISTLKSGFLGEGIKNFTPNEALCHIDIRFAHKINPQLIYDEINEIVTSYEKHTSANIELTKNIGYESSRVSKDSNLVKSLLTSFRKFDVKTEIWPISAAAAPLSMVQKRLGIDFIVGGMGIGGYAHQANEFMQLSSILKMRKFYCSFLEFFSQH